MGVDGDRGWKDPLVYTPIISAVVTVARMLVLYTAVKTRQDRVTEIMEKEGFSDQDADELANAQPPATLTATQHRKRPRARKITIDNVQERFCYLQRY
ncbi:unnamed protein product [Alternaria alternata]